MAVISDVHANLEALEAVLGQVKEIETVCLGDLVDYGANPNKVIERIRESGATTIKGNHDEAVVTGDISLFNPKAAMSSMWTRTRLSYENKAYLEGLPEELKLRIGNADAYFVHGSPDYHLWEYVDPRTDSDLLGFYLDKLHVRVIGLGHTHLPFVAYEPNGVVFNPGSVGQPRDGDPRASYAVMSVEGDSVDVGIRRVEYDVQKTASKIRKAGLPESHAQRLLTGT